MAFLKTNYLRMKKISNRTQAMFATASSKGINLEPIAQLYGLRFAAKLMKRILKTKQNAHEDVTLITPKFKVQKENETKAYEQYLSLVEKCGMKLKYWGEDLIDEDTGEVVTIERISLYTV